ncbi:MAG: ATP-binding cassette domain-containing protein [Anaerolineales bacterium]|nr:ATP-binding cassette domain-containing protein [Anaerolineales bacterium]
MGFFSGLNAEAYDRSYRDRDLTVRMLAYFRTHKARITLASIAILVIALSNAATPILISRSLDLMTENGSTQLMLAFVAAVFVLGVIIWGANWVRRRLISRAVADVMLDLRRDAFIAAAEHDLSFYDEFASGRIVSRITSDTQDFAQVVVLVTDLITQLIQSIILLVVLLSIDLQLTLWLVAMLPFVFLVALGFRKFARRVTRHGFRAMANVNAAVKEAVTGISVAKNFRQEDQIYEGFQEVNIISYQANVRRGLVLSSVFPTLNALMGVGTAIMVYVGGLSAAQGLVTVGAWYLFITGLDRFWFPVLNLSSFWTQVQNGLSAAERIFALIDAESVVIQIADQPVSKLRGEITFEDLAFHYKPGEPVLEGFDLQIKAGENLALVGHTGAGKSSIARLISRFYEFQGGRLLIDEQDIRLFNLQDYRRQLGIVSQTPFLFSGTVMENIRYAAPEVSDAEIEELARKIGGGEWIATLPEGLQSEVGERGNRLSMGTRQLVSLMRVLCQRPAIFILDEATASIDPFTESQIQEALKLILAGSTSILIAHRLSTVKASDRIIVLHEGQIIEEGNHDALMQGEGHYSELYNTYFRHQSLGYVETARDLLLGEE